MEEKGLCPHAEVFAQRYRALIPVPRPKPNENG